VRLSFVTILSLEDQLEPSRKNARANYVFEHLNESLFELSAEIPDSSGSMHVIGVSLQPKGNGTMSFRVSEEAGKIEK
jgi:hypothetical protein